MNGIVDALEPTLWLARRAELPAGVTLVSREGRLLSRHALVHYAPDSRTHGVIERQREIDQLEAEHLAREVVPRPRAGLRARSAALI